jgi:predicted dehydrogenase
LTVSRADPDRDHGDPVETTATFNRDPSWEREIDAFVTAIHSGTAPEHGTSHDALETLRLVFRIYYSDQQWRERYSIPDPGWPQ